MPNPLNTSYLNPSGDPPAIPLGRYLPDCPKGVIDRWLHSLTPAGSWILDPFGSTPYTAIHAAEAGYRVLAAVNNPLLAFELQMLCQMPSRNEFQSALAELAATRRGDTRLETLIRSFYMTRCATCGKEIQASAFVWKRGDKSPYARIYQCPYCGDEGLHPATEEDAERLAPLLRAEPLHRSRAREKAISVDMDEDEKHNVDEALKNYPVRALVVLFNLLNKLDAISLHPTNRKLLQALLLPVLDAGTNLWSWPDPTESSHLLLTPAEFIEKNLWLELESAIDLWQKSSAPLECTQWPTLPPNAGICIFPGRTREFQAETSQLDFSAVVCNLPRPSQAFWTLSALWSAWLWGKEVSARYVSVLGRRRFDWHWHARALHSTLEAVNHTIKKDTPVLGLLANSVPGFILSAAAAASTAGLSLSGLSCKSDREEVQFHWTSSDRKQEPGKENSQEILRTALRETFMDLGQPSSYLAPYTAAVGALAQHRLLPASDDALTPEKLSEIQSGMSKLFLDHTFLRHYDSAAQEIESGSWFLENSENCLEPVADRTETEVVKLLLSAKEFSLAQIHEKINAVLPGVLTPSDQLLGVCLESYAAMEPSSQMWHIKDGETPAKRKSEIKKMRNLLREIAARIGFTDEGDQPVIWRLPGENETRYRFFWGASAIFTPYTCQQPEEGAQTVFVFPASRSALIQYKLNHNPRLKEMVKENWHFLKFRHLTTLAQRSELDRELWMLLLDGDPLSSEKDIQLTIF